MYYLSKKCIQKKKKKKIQHQTKEETIINIPKHWIDHIT